MDKKDIWTRLKKGIGMAKEESQEKQEKQESFKQL